MTTQTIEAPTAVPLRETPDPIEVVKPLKLSEAIRLGSLGTEQARNWHETSYDDEGKPMHKMCAISTAWYALTGHAGYDGAGSPLSQMLDRAYVVHPFTGEVESLTATVIELNDSYEWTRPQIADWLEGMGL